jgi:hypothetical protein
MRLIHRLWLMLTLYGIRLVASVMRRTALVIAVLKTGPRAAREQNRFHNLKKMAEMALRSSSFEEAVVLAEELLKCAEKWRENWDYGNAIHHGHRIIGLVSLQQGKIDEARRHLISSGEIPGFPRLNSFGPNMQLAKAMLEAGEAESVIEYFQLCRKCWKCERGRLDAWLLDVRHGEMPSFGANLRYGASIH